MNPNWDTTLWGCCLRVIGLLLAGLVIIGFLRLMAWADTGSRGECPVEKSIIP